MKIGIMQPYLFPYIGYFQLIYAVDKFIFYDDVNYIKKGWINRNRILVNNNEFMFSVPIRNLSQYKKINETKISINEYNKWIKKFYKTIEKTYNSAPFFQPTIKIIHQCFEIESNNITDLCVSSVQSVLNYLGIKKETCFSSEKYSDTMGFDRSDRIIEICKRESANEYINPIGGIELYSKEYFREKGLDLYFLKSKNINYKQFFNDFVPWLSIIDVMMFNSKEEINFMLNQYELI